MRHQNLNQTLHWPVCVLRCAFKWELLVYTLLQPSKSHLWILLFLESGDSDLRGRRMLSILKGDMELQRGGETRDNVKPQLCSCSMYESTYYWLSQTINMFCLLLYLRNTQTSSCVRFHLAACLCIYSDPTLTEQQSEHRRMMAHWLKTDTL